MHHILVVDDDPFVTKLLTFLLHEEWYRVTTAETALLALALLQQQPIDLIILDIRLPGMDGLELCSQIRQTNQVPIIFLSAFSDVKDRVRALYTGGDDYIVKPFELDEVLARTWALLRHTRQHAQSNAQLRHTDLTIDPTEDLVTIHRTGKTIHLTPTEARLLRTLLSKAGRVVTREALWNKVWGYTYEASSNVLEVNIARLRTKLEQDPSQPTLLLTERGIGFRLRSSLIDFNEVKVAV